MRFALLLALVLATACGDDRPADAPAPRRGKPAVYTTFHPTTYFTHRVAGDLVDVVCPLPDDADPIFWMPDSETIRAYQEADLIVVNGAGLEQWIGKVSLPLARLVETARPFSAEWIEYEGSVTHSHGTAGEHAHEGLDGHTWLDPLNAKLQAREIERSLARLLPDHAETLGANLAALSADLDALDRAFRALGALPEGTHLYASHPAYNYLARRYGWKMVSFDLDPETMPPVQTLTGMGERLDASPTRYLLWESEPRPEVARRFREVLGLESIVFSPCETAPAEGDYLSVMRANLERLEPAFGKRQD